MERTELVMILDMAFKNVIKSRGGLISHIMKRLDLGKLLGGERFKTRCFNQILGPLYIVNIYDKDCILPAFYNKTIAIFNIDIFG